MVSKARKITRREEMQPEIEAMLDAAGRGRKARPLIEIILAWSEENGLLWHVDPNDYKDAQAVARKLLQQAIPTTYAGDICLREAVEAGPYAKLLGSKVLLTKKDQNSKADWCYGYNGKTATTTAIPPDGMSNPVILDLISTAIRAGEVHFASSREVRVYAKLGRRKQAIVIEANSKRLGEKIALMRELSETTGELHDLRAKQGMVDWNKLAEIAPLQRSQQPAYA